MNKSVILALMKNTVIVVLVFLISACSDKKPGVEIESSIWPYELYTKFNLRTIVSSYSNHLKYYCASYPKDFFRKDQLYMPSTDKIVIYDLNRTLSFELVSKNQVIVTDQVNDSYNAQHLYTIYHNEENDDYRSDMFYIQSHPNCRPLVLKADENVSKK